MKTTISKKVSCAVAALILCFTLIGDVIVFFYFRNVLLQNEQEHISFSHQVNTAHLNTVIQDIQTLMQSACTDPVIQTFCAADSDRTDFETVSKTTDVLRRYVKMRTWLQSISIVCNQEALWSAYPFEDDMTLALNEEWYQSFSPMQNGIQFSPLHFFNAESGKNTPIITCKLNVYQSYDPTQKAGEVLFHLNADELQRLLFPSQDQFDEFAVIDNKSGNILFHHTFGHSSYLTNFLADVPLEILQSPFNTEFSSTGYFSWSSLETADLTLVTYCPEEIVQESTRCLLIFFAIFIALTIISIVIAVSLLIGTMVSPIRQLYNGMYQFASGDLNARVDIHTNDELEQLGNQFNRMASDIQALITKQAEHEQQKKKLQFDLLLSRIHPHFLYNTLNSSLFLARRANAKDCENMLRALILMLQDGMCIYEDKLYDSLQKELDVVNAYCTIQSYRYKDKFTFSCEFAPEDAQLLIPKNILQPLVENAIFHGIVPASEPGQIELSVRKLDGQIELFLSDSGVGMNTEQLEKLCHGTATTQKGSVHSIGIQTIRDRMTYLFGSNYVMEVYSELGKGTTWLLQFPCINNEDIPS